MAEPHRGHSKQSLLPGSAREASAEFHKFHRHVSGTGGFSALNGQFRERARGRRGGGRSATINQPREGESHLARRSRRQQRRRHQRVQEVSGGDLFIFDSELFIAASPPWPGMDGTTTSTTPSELVAPAKSPRRSRERIRRRRVQRWITK